MSYENTSYYEANLLNPKKCLPESSVKTNDLSFSRHEFPTLQKKQRWGQRCYCKPT